MELREHQFKVRYTKAKDDIAEEFYLPCMKSAIKYDRISGYFRSTIFVIAWGALRDFVKNGGKMRIVCSPFVTEKDSNAAEEGYLAKSEPELAAKLNEEIEELFQNPYLSEPYRVLACLIAIGVLEIKIAVGVNEVRPDINKLLHEKSGIFEDGNGNVVAFEGSMNETFNGLSNDGNIEAIDVFVGWDNGRDAERVKYISASFNDFWNGKNDNIKLYDFPEQTKELLKRYSHGCDWEKIVDEIIEKDIVVNKWKAEKRPDGRKPRDHQVKALEAWIKNNRRGILEHATGSGKTYTALCAIRHVLDSGDSVLVLVPSKELLYQWDKEIKNVFAGDDALRILLCGDGNSSWRRNNLLYQYTSPGSNRKKVVIATMDTAASPDFLKGVCSSNKLTIIADEVHRLGSENRRSVFTINAGARLGLSATPKRYGDPVGTSAIFDYFGGIVEPKFTLEDAINAGVLTKYFYFPLTIQLTDDEQQSWNEKTKKISVEVARRMTDKSISKEELFDSPVIKRLLRERSRILKNASAKVGLAIQVIRDNFKTGQKWIIYCDNKVQLKLVMNEINKIKGIEGLSAYEYHSEMEGDRIETLAYFQLYGGVLVSIKCLDEGVDIPSTTHALILASSKNPREFIQRRGRILRRADEYGKKFAFLYDAIVVPSGYDPDNVKQVSIIESELARAIQFGGWAANKTVCNTELRTIAIKNDIDLDEMIAKGNEDDDENE